MNFPKEKVITLIKRFWWVAPIVICIFGLAAFFLSKPKEPQYIDYSQQTQNGQHIDNTGTPSDTKIVPTKPQSNALTPGDSRVVTDFSGLPDCPSDLSGLLTASMVDPNAIVALIPLGNANPPTHTFPVDHVYFTSSEQKGKIPKLTFYVPGTGFLTAIQETKNYSGKAMTADSYLLTIALCKGVMVSLGGVTSVVPSVMSQVPTDKVSCQTLPGKHVGETSFTQCKYNGLHIPVTAGQAIGTTGVDEIPEVWAYNYNIDPNPDIQWKQYGYMDYAYAFCLFDMYSGDLKNTWFNKFGSYNMNTKELTKRTIAPLCGTVHEDIVGTLQGDWFGETADNGRSPEFDGKGISFSHDNIDPAKARIVIGGNISKTGIEYFQPQNSGLINRAFSEVTADGKIYCYQNTIMTGWQISGKFLVQLTDAHHLKIENQTGKCTGTEQFKKPVIYQK